MNERRVEHVTLADAKHRLDELVARAASGETIVIEREDGSSARLQPEPTAQQQAALGAYDWDEHWRWLQQQPLDGRAPDVIDAELRSLDRY